MKTITSTCHHKKTHFCISDIDRVGVQLDNRICIKMKWWFLVKRIKLNFHEENLGYILLFNIIFTQCFKKIRNSIFKLVLSLSILSLLTSYYKHNLTTLLSNLE